MNKAKDNWINRLLIKMGFNPHPSNWLHFAFGAAAGIFAFVFTFYQIEFSLWAAVRLSTGFGLFTGLIKELMDLPKFDWLDLFMTTLGGFAGAMLGTLITLVL